MELSDTVARSRDPGGQPYLNIDAMLGHQHPLKKHRKALNQASRAQ